MPTADGTGFIVDEGGFPPEGCACLTGELKEALAQDPNSPALDPLYEAILVDARENCEQLATAAGQDSSPCDTAIVNKSGASVTGETFPECNEVVGKIDEDKDGYCPDPDEGGETGDGETGGSETGSDDGDDRGSIEIPDLGKHAP